MKTKLVIFGITGDLSRSKLLPALSEIIATGGYDDLEIIGVSRRDVVATELLEAAKSSNLADRTRLFTMDLAEEDDYTRLKESLGLQDDEQVLMYLSVPPNASADIVDFLGKAGLNTPNVKILFEKPFGFDLASARDFIERTGRYYNEEQLYRIDHYMAKEVAQEIIHLRSNAENKHHSWDKTSVTSIEVVASETLAAKERAVFYEQTGALRDVLQGHLMQLLSLILMDIPHGFSLEYLPEQRLNALKQVRLADPAKASRAQYEGYQDDVANPGSLTETFAHLELESEAERWQGVSLRLASGKKLDKKHIYIKMHYTDGTEDIFEESQVLREGRLPDAYERVLVEAINGRKSIFTTSLEVLRSWEILAPIQEAWEMDNAPLRQYTPGSSVDQLLA